MPELDPATDKPIHAEFPEWDIQPVEPVGWSATTISNDGRTIRTVGAPTVHELRLRLREVTERASQPRRQAR